MMRAVSPNDAALVSDEPAAAGRVLRIAVVTETYPPDVNGVAFTAARSVDGLRRRRHDVRLFRLRPRGDRADRDGDDVLLPGLPIPGHAGLQMGMPSTRALLRAWSERRPDVVHIVTEGPLGASALRAAERLALPVVSDFRTNFHTYSGHYGVGWLNRPIAAYLRRFHNRTLCTMVPTQALARELDARGYRRLAVVARGVDIDRFTPARRSEALRRSWGAGPSTRVLLCVSRLAPEKNIGLAWRAYDECRRRGDDVRLVIVGDGPARRELEARCSGAIFAGVRRGDELAACYASADLFVFPSLTETYGNVVPEALASGLPVVAYDCAAAAELVRRGEHGLLAAPHDEAGFSRCVTEAVAHDEALLAMGAAARAAAHRLGWEPVIDRLEGVLLQASRRGAIDAQAAPSLAFDG